MPAKNMSRKQTTANTHSLSPSPQTAGLLRRLAAMLYDAILSLALAFGITAGGILLRITLQGEELVRKQGVALQGEQTIWLQACVALALFLFFAGFWTKSGQTLGMQAWRLRIDNEEGGRISWQQAFIRYIGAAISAACLGLGYLWQLFDKDGRSWHDRWSRSRVVLLPSEKKHKVKKRKQP